MNLLSVNDFSKKKILELIGEAKKIKNRPKQYENKLKNKTLLLFFELPSLRTRLSFETAIHQLGGHSIFYKTDPGLWKLKESISDSSKNISLFSDIVTLRLVKHKDIEEFAQNSSIPVINALTDMYHPCQILSDMLTIIEHKKRLQGLKLAYLGDSNNNITHSLLICCSRLGLHISVACPKQKEYSPQKTVIEKAKEYSRTSKNKIEITSDPVAAVKDADIIYTDSWMSYAIPKAKQKQRKKILKKYQVNSSLLKKAKPGAIFMHCLPATRGKEVTADVIDGPKSVVFKQAENRLH
ncbi:ornithine carbamoyltransferase, partial [Candidatus Woesearchaeota archaeon]|nr:ornithine carbamoyltransferase [Candidatus Woesearchaeota archaeon]